MFTRVTADGLLPREEAICPFRPGLRVSRLRGPIRPIIAVETVASARCRWRPPLPAGTGEPVGYIDLREPSSCGPGGIERRCIADGVEVREDLRGGLGRRLGHMLSQTAEPAADPDRATKDRLHRVHEPRRPVGRHGGRHPKAAVEHVAEERRSSSSPTPCCPPPGAAGAYARPRRWPRRRPAPPWAPCDLSDSKIASQNRYSTRISDRSRAIKAW